MTRLVVLVALLSGCSPAAAATPPALRPVEHFRTIDDSTPRPVAPAPFHAFDPPGPTARPSATSTIPEAAGVRPGRAGITGVASWFRSPTNVSAAGPALRRAIGSRWRGTRIVVCAGRCVSTVLGDWCACPGGRIVDLDDGVFGRLAPLSRGIATVTVTW